MKILSHTTSIKHEDEFQEQKVVYSSAFANYATLIEGLFAVGFFMGKMSMTRLNQVHTYGPSQLHIDNKL